MTFPRFSSHLLAIAIASFITSLRLAGEEPVKLTLQAAINEAIAQSPTLLVIAAEIDAARGEVQIAGTRPNAELAFTPGIKRVSESEKTHDEFKGTLQLTRTFDLSGRRELLLSLAGRNVELRELAIASLRFQVTAAVRQRFYELLTAQSIVGLRQQQLESAQAFQQVAAKRAESGYASDFEAVKSQGEVINARKLLQAAENQIATARVELSLLLGRDSSAPLEVAGALDGTLPVPSVPALVGLALAENPSLRVQAMQAEIAGLNLRHAQRIRKSDLTVGPSLEYSKSEQVIGISASIALSSKNYGQGEILTATAEQRKVLAETEQLRREIIGTVTRAATQWSGARAQLALYSPIFLAQLKAAVAQAESSYAQNETPLLVYLDTKRTYFDTLADYHEALANVARSRAELESAVGAPLQ